MEQKKQDFGINEPIIDEKREKKERLFRERVKERLSKELMEGEGVVEALAPEYALTTKHILISVVGMLFGLGAIIFATVLVVFPEFYPSGSSFALWYAAGALLLAAGFVLLFIAVAARAKGGLILTDKKRIIGYGGVFSLKRLEAKVDEVSSLSVIFNKTCYFMSIKNIMFIYVQNPIDFEAAFYELKNKN